MSPWETGAGQWQAWIDEGPAAAPRIDAAMDDVDQRILSCFATATFPGQSWGETRIEATPPQGGPQAEAPPEPFDSMATVVRAAPDRVPPPPSLEIALHAGAPAGAEHDALTVSLTATADEELPTLVKRADPLPDPPESDGELFIPTLTRTADTAPAAPAVAPAAPPDVLPPSVPPAVRADVLPPSVPPAVRADVPPDVRADVPPEAQSVPPAIPPVAPAHRWNADQSASASQTSGMISVDDDVESARTITRGEIIRESEPDPVVPRARIVVDPSASGVLPTPEEDDPEELDAEDVEQLDDTAPPPGSSLPVPPPARTPEPHHAGDAGPAAAPDAGVHKTVVPPTTPPRADGPPPAPAPADHGRHAAHDGPPPAPYPTAGGTEIRPAEIPPPRAVPAFASGGTMPPTERSWVDDVFGEHYPALLPPNHAEQARAHVEFFVQCTQLPLGSRILDVACGGGAHSIALAARGYQVTGFDASAAQVARAQSNAEGAAVRAGFVVGDMRAPPVDGPFDGAICFGSSFGVFGDDEDLECLRQIGQRLVPGGLLMLNVFNRDYMVGRLPTRSWWQGQGCLVLDEAQLDSLTSRVRVHRTVVFEDGRQFDHHYGIRAYGLNEIVQACQRAGMALVEYAGSPHTRGRFFGASSKELWVLVRRT